MRRKEAQGGWPAASRLALLSFSLDQCIFLVEFPVVDGRYLDIQVRVQRVDVFQQVNGDDAVIVDAQGLANGILCDLETAVQVAFEGRFKVEGQEERQVVLAQVGAQGGTYFALAV